jgi:hypothetical protein
VFPNHFLFNKNELLNPVAGVIPEGALNFDRFNSVYFVLLDKRIRELAGAGRETDERLHETWIQPRWWTTDLHQMP